MKNSGQFKLIDLAGQVFGKLTVVRFHEKASNGGSKWLCRCECGRECVVWAEVLKRQPDIRCKECRKEVQRAQRTTHGMKYTPEYMTWNQMKDRCLNSNSSNYRHYCARGITICDRWLSFENFFKDMGLRPSIGHTLDRIDNDGNYTPENCRWAEASEQANNRRTNQFLTFNGKTQTWSQWAREIGLDKTVIRQRARKGWPVEKILSLDDFRK